SQNHELKQNILIFIRLFQESGKLIESRLGKIEASREGLPAVIPNGVALQSITLARSARDGFCMNPFRNLRLLTDSCKIYPTGLLIAEREGLPAVIPNGVALQSITLARSARDGFCMNPFRNLRLLTDSCKIHPTGLLIAEREGFEPSIPFRVY